MTLHKIDLTIYGENPDTIMVILPDLMRIVKAAGLNYKVSTLLKEVVK
jgi:hypothetical protein